jgi:16S rRNA (cytidine1402-2'-O)-methyltransferase
VLEEAAIIAAEDTRRTTQLLSSFGCKTPLMALHEHNEADRLPQLLERLRDGENVALVSDAGTPLISDPGFQLVRACREQGLVVVPVPGASAVMAALQVGGLPTDRFVFEGFLPRKGAKRRERLAALACETRTVVVFEAVHRIAATVAELADSFGSDRDACLARELTKLHENVTSGTLGDLHAALTSGTIPQRGEFVILVGGASEALRADLAEARRIYTLLAAAVAPDEALKLTARITGLGRNALYGLLRTHA